MNQPLRKGILGLFVVGLILLLWNYAQGYDQSISWSVTTTADIVEFPALTIENGLIEHEISGEKYILSEKYSGGEIERSFLKDQLYLILTWFGLCIFLAMSTTFGRYTFFVVMAGFALLLNRLNLGEIGLFGIESKMVLAIPFIAFLIPLVYFHEYRKETEVWKRLIVLVVISIALGLGIGDAQSFTDHFIAHSLFGFAICALLFLILISEELMFLFLYVVTSTKGGKSNHLHFSLLSLIYLANLTLYYLNKSGLHQNSFFFFDPYILLAISSAVVLWSIQFKGQAFEGVVPAEYLPKALMGLGIITFGFLGLSMQRGLDTVPQSFHYFILYAHLGFGALFFLYIIANFLDPLIKGFEVHKIAYRERNFPYVTARLGGTVAVIAFYLLSGQEAYNLLRSGYYSYLSVKEENLGNELLAKEYLINSEFLGFNAHFPNYNLAWDEWQKGNEFRTKANFFNATQRYPSTYAWINYGNLEAEENPNKVQALYEESLRWMDSPEMKNNLGLLHLDKGETDKALEYFSQTEAFHDWNEAPLINKWKALHKAGEIDSSNLEIDYLEGNFGVKSNILAQSAEPSLEFQFEDLASAPILHRQAYLVNSAYASDHDSIESFIRKELATSTSGTTNSRLANALAIHLYKKGYVNSAFKVYDELQANSSEINKGQYLDALGKLALDQGAYRLAQDFFTEAIQSRHEISRINRLEAFAGQQKQEAISSDLLKIVQQDPGLTNRVNQLLEQIESYVPKQAKSTAIKLDTLNTDRLVALASRNAFDEPLVLKSIEELSNRDSVMNAYDILVEAIEINPYSPALLQQYVLTAIEWNLNDYAEQALSKLEELITEEEFASFAEMVSKRREELLEEEW